MKYFIIKFNSIIQHCMMACLKVNEINIMMTSMFNHATVVDPTSCYALLAFSIESV